MSDSGKGFNTKLIHCGENKDSFGSPITPIYQTSTFAFKSADHGAKCFSEEIDGYIYTRIDNPTIRDLEKSLAILENGYDGIATSSGMAAINCIYLGLLSNGAHLISHNAIYGAARGVIENYFSKFGVEYSYIDASNLNNTIKAYRPNTKLIYIETPANPTMDIIDIKATADFAHSKGIPLVVDNTFCSPYLQNPLNLGADIVVHSMTKFINGHADIVAGMIIPKTKELYKLLRTVMINLGCNMDPNQAFLTRRGLKTLSLRIDRAQGNAAKIAEFLENHPKVEWVRYPGLKSHPAFELAQRQMRGNGSLISVGLKGGISAGKILLDNVKLFILAVSLGGVESLIQHPASMTHVKISEENRLKAGISDGLIRISVGIEDIDDLIADLTQALDKV